MSATYFPNKAAWDRTLAEGAKEFARAMARELPFPVAAGAEHHLTLEDWLLLRLPASVLTAEGLEAVAEARRKYEA